MRTERSVAYGKAGAEQARGELGIFGNLEFLDIEGGGFATSGSEKFVVKRIESRGGEQRISLGKSDRDAKAGIAVGEIRGAIQRINVPAKFRSRSALMPRSLLGSNGVLGKILREPLNDQPFRTPVRLRDQIHLIAFVCEIPRARQFFHQDFPGFLRNLYGSVEIVLGHFRKLIALRKISPLAQGLSPLYHWSKTIAGL